MYKIDSNITVRDNVTMITISNKSKIGCMSAVLKQLMSLDMPVEILDYHSSYAGDKLTVLVDNGGILRVMGAVGMFKESMRGIMCDIYCLNSSVTVKIRNTPTSDAALIMSELSGHGIELCHLYSGMGGITVVINEAYTDEVCGILADAFGKRA